MADSLHKHEHYRTLADFMAGKQSPPPEPPPDPDDLRALDDLAIRALQAVACTDADGTSARAAALGHIVLRLKVAHVVEDVGTIPGDDR